MLKGLKVNFSLRLGLKEKQKVKPGSNPKVQWHGDEGEHGTHNGPSKGDVYITLEPPLSANNLRGGNSVKKSEGNSGY